jgi:4'-phosphopantetheinyl transferase EntD
VCCLSFLQNRASPKLAYIEIKDSGQELIQFETATEAANLSVTLVFSASESTWAQE